MSSRIRTLLMDGDLVSVMLTDLKYLELSVQDNFTEFESWQYSSHDMTDQDCTWAARPCNLNVSLVFKIMDSVLNTECNQKLSTLQVTGRWEQNNLLYEVRFHTNTVTKDTC